MSIFQQQKNSKRVVVVGYPRCEICRSDCSERIRSIIFQQQQKIGPSDFLELAKVEEISEISGFSSSKSKILSQKLSWVVEFQQKKHKQFFRNSFSNFDAMDLIFCKDKNDMVNFCCCWFFDFFDVFEVFQIKEQENRLIRSYNNCLSMFRVRKNDPNVNWLTKVAPNILF